MLADRAYSLIDRIENLQRLQDEQKKIETYHTRLSLLSKPTSRLTKLKDVVDLLRQNGIDIEIDFNRVKRLNEHAQVIAKTFEADPECILRGDKELRFGFWQPLERLPGEIEEAARTSWQHYLDQTLRTGHTEVLGVLEKVPGFGDKTEKIRSGLRKKEKLRSDLPHSTDDILAVESLGQELHNAWDDLGSDQISEEIAAFLMAAINGRATVQQLTDDVMAWLRSNDLLTVCRVTL